MNAKSKEKLKFAERLATVMASKSIKFSPTTLKNIFNESYEGPPVTAHSARNWMLGISIPTQEKLVCLAKIFGTSAEYLRFGQHIEKTFVILQIDGSEIELSNAEQQFVRSYTLLTLPQQQLFRLLLDELLKI